MCLHNTTAQHVASFVWCDESLGARPPAAECNTYEALLQHSLKEFLQNTEENVKQV
jgi:hypothetical protein